jgi:hypothetical protein
VPEQFLDGADVVAVFQQVGGEGMPQRMGADGLSGFARPRRLADGALDDGFVQVVAANFLARGIGVRAGRRKDPLPDPLAYGALGYLRSMAPGRATAPAPRLMSPSCWTLTAARCERSRSTRTPGRTVRRSFWPLPLRTMISRRSRSMSFTRSCSASSRRKPRAIQERADQPDGTLRHGQEAARFFPSQHHRDMHRPLGVNQVAQPLKLAPKHLLVQEQQRGQGLVLRRGADLASLARLDR